MSNECDRARKNGAEDQWTTGKILCGWIVQRAPGPVGYRRWNGNDEYRSAEQIQIALHGLQQSVTGTARDIVADDRAVVKWDMEFRHRKLSGGKSITVRGVTIVEFRELICTHEDIFDLGSMIYENVPIVGMQIRYLKQRLEAA